MTPLYDTQEFYKKMLELQERLRKSEEERMKLEERFNLLSQDSRTRREACINNLRMRYIEFLEEQRLRDERNHQILGSLDKIDGSLARMTARTDRLGILRKQYEAYLLRVYANRNTGDGTGDSGVGSHNEQRSPKTNISQTEKSSPSTQRIIPQNAGNPPSFIPQTNYPQSYIGASNISQFNVPRYTQGQEIPRVQVMQAHGQGDGSTFVQSQRMPQLYYGPQNLNTTDTLVSKTQLQMPANVSQQIQNYPQQFRTEVLSRSNNQLPPNFPQVQDISNQHLGIQRSSYASDPAMMRSQNLSDSHEVISTDFQPLSGLQSERLNRRDVVNFSGDSTDEAFGPYRHSTPLPGYLDYSTRYSRDATVQDSNAPLRYGFTRSDLEKVINRNEPILPKDYLHNPETVKPAMQTSKVSLLLEDKQRVSDAKPGRGLNDDKLDQYIHRIRSLHRDNDQSLEALDIEQNTSGDLLNATLSDDGLEQLTLHSDDKIKPIETKIISDDLKNVFALADDFVAKTRDLGDGSQFKSDSLNDREMPSESVFSPQIYNEKIIAKPTFAESKDVSPVILKADTISDNISTSVTRDDILSETPSVDVNQIPDTSAIANGKFKSKIIPPITDLDTSRLNIADVATVSQNNLIRRKELSPNERSGNQVSSSSSQKYMKILEEKSNPEVKVIKQKETPIEVPNIQLAIKNHGFPPKEIEHHEDIEGDKVSLIEGEQMPEQVIDVIRELQPPNLQHYEKNVVEIREGNEDKKDVDAREVVPDRVTESKIQENEDNELKKNAVTVNVAKISPKDFIAKKIHPESDVTDQKYSEVEKIEEQMFDSTKKEVNNDIQYQDDVEPNFSHGNPTYEHQTEQNLPQDGVENLDADQRFEQNPEQLYDPVTSEQLDYDSMQINNESNRLDKPYIPTSVEPYDSNQIYDANQQYETYPNEQNPQESNPQFAYDSNQHLEDDLNQQYTTDPTERYAAHPNEQYTSDPNEQYLADPNEQYATDPNEHFAADPNEQYAIGSNEQYATDPNEHFAADPNEQYAIGSNEQYATDPNEQFAADPNEQYAIGSNEQYATDPNEHFAADPNEQYQTDPNQEYTGDSNEQYGYYHNQPYEDDPNATYEHGENEQYDYGADQGYQHDPNQQFEHDPNQQYEIDPNNQYEHDPNQEYEHDPNQQYEHDPNQQYELNPNESSEQDLNREYKGEEYGQNQIGESVGYGETEQGSNQQFDNDSQQNYADHDRNLEVQSTNQDYQTVAAGEKNEIQTIAAVTGDSYNQELFDPDDIAAKEYSADEKKKSKDVIKALLESDTESTIERNPSNNTESDFDFN